MSGFDSMNVSELQRESERLQQLVSQTETTLADLKASFQTVRSILAVRLRPSPEPRVSDHALMRWIERVYGIDVEAVRAEIMSPGVVAALKAGATGVTVKGIKMIAKDGTIVTVVTDEIKNAGKAKRSRPYRENEEDEAA